MAVVVFDLETTGLRPETGAEILEVAAAELVFDDDGLCRGASDAPEARFYERCRPAAGHITPFIQNLTGIAWDAVKDADPPAAVVPRFFEWLRDRQVTTLVGHNAIGFDIRFLRQYAAPPPEIVAASASGKRSPESSPLTVFDTLIFARHEDGAGPYAKGYRQSDLYLAAFDEPQPDQHTAMGDVTGLSRLIGHRGWASAIQEEGTDKWVQKVSLF